MPWSTVWYYRPFKPKSNIAPTIVERMSNYTVFSMKHFKWSVLSYQIISFTIVTAFDFDWSQAVYAANFGPSRLLSTPLSVSQKQMMQYKTCV